MGERERSEIGETEIRDDFSETMGIKESFLESEIRDEREREREAESRRQRVRTRCET